MLLFISIIACRTGKVSVQDSGLNIDADGDGFTAAQGDCDDANPLINPDAQEECDGVDNDCDGDIDPVDIAGEVFFLDGDGDGFGGEEVYACSIPDGYVLDGGDCNDDDNEIFPQAIEQCGDEIDQNCDGLIDNEACFYTVNDAQSWLRSDVLFPLGVGGTLVDSNGDGVLDVVTHSPTTTLTSSGVSSFHIFEGPLSGEISSSDASHRILLPDLVLGGGSVISSDMNGDGQDDLLFSLDRSNLGGENGGAVFLVHGPIEENVSLEDSYDALWYGSLGSNAGYSIDNLGDVTGDGQSDVVIGAYEYDQIAPEGGAAYIVFGGENEGDLSLSTADVVLFGDADENLGYEVSSAGDVNGDGVLDVAINAYRFDTTQRNAGRTFIFFGPIDSTLSLEQADIRIDGFQEVSQSGSTLSPVPDINGDGTDDILLASQFADVLDDTLTHDQGVAHILVDLEPGDISLLDSHASIYGESIEENFGREALGLQDLNGDGFGEVIISAKRYGVSAPEQGRVSLFLGPLEGSYTSGQGHALLYGAREGAWTGISMDVHQYEDETWLLLGSREVIGEDVLGESFLLSIDFFE
ncbi:MAG: hypothetical protein CL916_00265 [Deltaproteobacteria bacterium]|nr:hypothetical protein [Deltaproteobacteria bacterium]